MRVEEERILILAKRLIPVDFFTLAAVELEANLAACQLLGRDKACMGKCFCKVVVVGSLSSTALKEIDVLELRVSVITQTTYKATSGPTLRQLKRPVKLVLLT